MTEQQVQEWLVCVLEEAEEAPVNVNAALRIGLTSKEFQIVITMPDNSEFCLSIEKLQ